MERADYRQEPNWETFVGVLIPSGWDGDFHVSKISLACNGEKDIAIANLEERPDLLALLQKRVRIAGPVDPMRKAVTVKWCRLEDEDANHRSHKE
ncbi:hypothetical protein [Salidesulfovibrio onnuriiensis]|uniref:hypothetical protein n=1 Tax=Salidesulfovibrio onnuriiensis TaxID=2583823 RepID=UPI0011CA280F|nr:hypothetical protein [Salidesulfovibrio onnuriiensis]